MARLERLFTIGIAVAVLAGCQQSLAVKDSIVKAVDAARTAAPSLTLWDGTTQIAYGGTATWADTMYTTATTKTFTIKNEGSLDLTLNGATPVTITGTGQAAYASITQPASSTIAAGASTTFTVTFNPPAQVADYPATLVIASNDPTHASYTFSATGHSSEWHGVKTILSTASCAAAKVGYSVNNANTVYVVYYDSAKLMLVKSSDKGATWGTSYQIDGTTAQDSSYISMAIDDAKIYIVYQNTSGNAIFIQVNDGDSLGFSKSPAQTISGSGLNKENSIAFDSTKIYIAYNDGGCPKYIYAPKSTLSFSSPMNIETMSSMYNMPISIKVDSLNNVDVAYFDKTNNELKYAQYNQTSWSLGFFMPSSSPSSPSSPSPIANADYPSMVMLNMSNSPYEQLVSFYDTSAKSYLLYESYLYQNNGTKTKNDVVTIDSSANVGISGVTISQNGNLYTAYYDATNSNLKFAVGTQSDPAVGYTFTSKVIASAGGGTSFTCSFVSDQNTNFYVVYYDSTAAALKIAKSLDTGATW